MSATIDFSLFAALADRISGSVLGPEDAGYEPARTVHNGLAEVQRA